jgi:UDP-galactopyranose mutase|tara:strand:+ start:158 stop:1261 length:1104 start_codon:yes stop_codon:yes gene_type:complete
MKKAIIIGAGISGSIPAMLLKEKGWSVTVIDKASYIGGGLRTFFHGGHPFTYGPRHFLSPHPEAYEFLNKYVPLRDITKINYTFIESDNTFYTYPPHEEDVPIMPEAAIIQKELKSLPDESPSPNFEEFWLHRVGPTLYGKFIKEYNKKAWFLDSNTEMDFGLEGTVKRRPLETGGRHEFKDWFNCYPIPHDGYNQLFDKALEDCQVLLDTHITGFDLEGSAVHIGDQRLKADVLVSTISPDTLMDYQYGELGYVGREFHNIVLPLEFALPEDVYFVYYPNANESHTRVVEYKKFTMHRDPTTLLSLEIPSRKNKLYPTLIQSEVDKAQQYIDALPDNVLSVGRMGTYRYKDIDDIILESIECVGNL